MQRAAPIRIKRCRCNVDGQATPSPNPAPGPPRLTADTVESPRHGNTHGDSDTGSGSGPVATRAPRPRPTQLVGLFRSRPHTEVSFPLVCRIVAADHGLWRSLVAHYTGGVGVAGSNPVSP